MSVPRLFLLDANALCYRSFYAIRGLVTSTGQPTNAVYGFTNTLRKIIKDFSPEYMAVCFDVGKKTHRTEKYAQYKVQRPPMPEDLVGQIRSIKDVVEAHNLPILEREGYEADDLIATAVEEFKDQGVEIVIVSDDKDMYQLLGPGVKVYSIRKDKLLGEKEAEETLGFSPRLIPDYIALAGDQSDNIPGVKGVGDVSAKKILAQYGTLEKLLAKIDAVQPDKLREKLTAQRDMAVLSKELALLSERVDLKVGLDDLKVGEPDLATLQDLYRGFEFRRFADDCAKALSAQQQVSSLSVTSDKDSRALTAKADKAVRTTRVVGELRRCQNTLPVPPGLAARFDMGDDRGSVDPGRSIRDPLCQRTKIAGESTDYRDRQFRIRLKEDQIHKPRDERAP